MAWLDGWTYRKKFTVSHAAGALVNYQVPLSANQTEAFVGGNGGTNCDGNVDPTFKDIRFTTEDGTTLCDYWIEDLTGADPNVIADIWIKLPAVATTATPFYMYYGKGDATDASNGTDTFVVFDNFERGSNGDAIGGSWTVQQGTVQISTAQAYGGTRSMYLGYSGTVPAAYIAVVATGEDIAVQYRLYKETAAKHLFYLGDGSTLIYATAADTEDVTVYDGATQQDTGLNVNADAWNKIEFTDIDWTNSSESVDVHVNGVSADNSDCTYSNAGFPNQVALGGSDGVGEDVWIDNFLVRAWSATEPVYGVWESEFEAGETEYPIYVDQWPIDATTGDEISSEEWDRYTQGICALEAKVGVTTSTVNTTLDWKLTSAGSYDPGHKQNTLYDSTGTKILLLDSGDISASALSAIYIDQVKYGVPAASTWPDLKGRTVYRVADNSFFGANLQDEGGITPKTSDEDVNNSAALQNDNEILFAVSAGGCYRFEALLFVEGCSAADIKYDWDPTAGSTMYWTNESFANNIEATPALARLGPDAVSRGLANVNIEIIHRHWGIIFAGDAGNFRLQWAQDAASAYVTTVMQRSNIQFWRIY